jgi:hypothetical protein
MTVEKTDAYLALDFLSVRELALYSPLVNQQLQ